MEMCVKMCIKNYDYVGKGLTFIVSADVVRAK